MNRLLLSVVGAALAGAVAIPALAATTTDTATRTQLERKRDQVSGVARLKAPEKGPATVLETPVVTEDAPSQVTKP